jgi:lysophospholipase L1-like esterase
VLAISRRLFAILASATLAACGGGTGATPTAAPATAPLTAAPTVEATTAPTQAAGLTLVAIGDSIPYNSEDDCPECVGFVDQYGTALGEAAGKTVTVQNNSEHNNNTVDLLLAGLTSQQNRIDAVAGADAIVVGIAHNDVPMNRDDDACDGAGGENPDWSKFTDECLATEVALYTPKYEALYARVAELRAGKPTILRTINRYNDWNGWPSHDLSANGLAATVKVIDAWNSMLCAAAEKSGFLCADISTVFNGAEGTKESGDLLAGDYTHPSQKGNDAIAKALIDLGFAPLAP